MKPRRSKWSRRPNAGYFSPSLDEDCAFVLKGDWGEGGGRAWGGVGWGWGATEVKSASLSGSVSLVNHRPPFSSLSAALPLCLLEVVYVRV